MGLFFSATDSSLQTTRTVVRENVYIDEAVIVVDSDSVIAIAVVAAVAAALVTARLSQ